MSALTWNQVAFFRHNGYFILDDRIPEPEISGLREIVLDHVDRRVAPYRTFAGSVMRLDGLLTRHPAFEALIRHPLLLGPLQSLLGPNIEYHRYRHNHATLNRRGDSVEGQGGMGYHADSLQWSRPVITVIVYADDTTLENGATKIIPGSHNWPFVTKAKGGRGGNWLADSPEYLEHLNQGLPVPLARGSVLLFDSLLFHTAGTNQTDDMRMSFTLGYRSVDELSRDGQEQCELICGERVYRGNDVDVRTGNWMGDVVT